MTGSPMHGATRRSLLRLVAVAGGAATLTPGLTPGVVGAAAEAVASTAVPARRPVPVRSKKPQRCKRSQVRVKGRCRRKKKAPTTPSQAPTPSPPPAGTTTPPAPGIPEAPATTLDPGGLLGAADRHLVTRFSYGVDATLAGQVAAAGGAGRWFERQLVAGTTDPATVAVQGWWPSLSRGAAELWQRQVDGVEGGWLVMNDYQRYLLVRRMRSSLTVLDVMTEFWENHLNVPVNGDVQYLFRVSYGDTVRQHALGRFSDLLTAAVTHPAMLVYLNAAVSTAAHPNENLGRELLELHTVGRGQYDESDVKASARILTGFHVDLWNTWVVSYRAADHAVGPVAVMGFTNANAAADGRGVAAAYLSYLARHPATAERIARKLAVKFVGDDASDALVDQLAQVYLANDTAIAPVLRALVASPEFAGSAFGKVRDPGEDVVATYKALGVTVLPPTSQRQGDSAETAVLWQCDNLGATPHGWPRPDGAPTDNASWSSPSRMLASLDLHYTMSGGWWPSAGLTRPIDVDRLPAASVSFRDLVEHLSNTMLHLHTPDGLLEACCLSVDVTPDTVITAEHRVVRWQFARVLTTLLDSPHHLKR